MSIHHVLLGECYSGEMLPDISQPDIRSPLQRPARSSCWGYEHLTGGGTEEHLLRTVCERGASQKRLNPVMFLGKYSEPVLLLTSSHRSLPQYLTSPWGLHPCLPEVCHHHPHPPQNSHVSLSDYQPVTLTLITKYNIFITLHVVLSHLEHQEHCVLWLPLNLCRSSHWDIGLPQKTTPNN